MVGAHETVFGVSRGNFGGGAAGWGNHLAKRVV
jgi:hypothetical protein